MSNCVDDRQFFLYIIAKQLIVQLLKTDPSERMTIVQFMNHPWISVRSLCVNLLSFSCHLRHQ